MHDKDLRETLRQVAYFYDQRKVGDVGFLGFRRSTDLTRVISCLDGLIDEHIIVPGESLFLDMGCADGRVNIFFSYVVRKSIGIELDEWTLDEYSPLKEELERELEKRRLSLPPENTFLFHGDSMDNDLYDTILKRTGVHFEDFDIFYTYLIMQEEFAGLIAQKARKGAIFMVYGLERIQPGFEGLRLLTPEMAMEGVLALYEKI